ncbi:MAG TPA: sterol desaturase family protein [Pedococcus sp.]|nr:sterol desaturase family protein [Pedococcus sp.]
MTRPSPEIEKLAQERLAADEKRMTGPRRTSVSLGEAWQAFLRHPSPWMIGGLLTFGVVARVLEGDYRWTDAVLPLALVAAFPLIEWVIHVFVLHWRPRRLGPVELDSLLARKHREHHADPRDIPLVFIPWQVLAWLLPTYLVMAYWVFPRDGLGLTFVVSVATLGFVYEWTHYLVHSDYRPRSKPFRAVWRNHRLHHYKNEHYWFTVTTAGTADRLLGTYPEPNEVETSPTVRALHASEPA